jgi:hypothetical protein
LALCCVLVEVAASYGALYVFLGNCSSQSPCLHAQPSDMPVSW